ncbi:MAG: 3-oxoacyl-ACP synthase, partial [Azonexus sp.]
ATKSMAPCQVLCAYDASFGAGLLDALAQVVVDRQPTLLIAYDSEYPEPLHSKRDIPDCAGVALLLMPEKTDRSLARITVTQAAGPPDLLADFGMESLRQKIPALRCLPLLQKLARGESGDVCLDYLPPMQLQVRVQSC